MGKESKIVVFQVRGGGGGLKIVIKWSARALQNFRWRQIRRSYHWVRDRWVIHPKDRLTNFYWHNHTQYFKALVSSNTPLALACEYSRFSLLFAIRNVPSGEEQGKTALFAGYLGLFWYLQSNLHLPPPLHNGHFLLPRGVLCGGSTVKWNRKPPRPLPPQIKAEASRRAKLAFFPFLIGGRGV